MNKTNSVLVAAILVAVLVLLGASSTSAALRTCTVSCDAFGQLDFTWDVLPAVGDEVRIQNLTGHPIMNIKRDGELLVKTQATGTNTGPLAVVSTITPPDPLITFCARCDAPKALTDYGCVDLPYVNASGVVYDTECGTCKYYPVPSLTGFGIAVLLLLLVLSAVILIRRQRQTA